MSVRSRAGRPARRDLVLALEGLEARELLSYAALFARAESAVSRTSRPPRLHVRPSPVAPQRRRRLRRRRPAVAASSGGLPRRIPPILKTLAQIVYPPGTPQPTNRELVREAISANFSGDYTTGPGRFSDQAMTINLTAFGGANFSFHTNLTGVLYTPVNPATSSAGWPDHAVPPQRPDLRRRVQLRPDRDGHPTSTGSRICSQQCQTRASPAAFRFPQA